MNTSPSAAQPGGTPSYNAALIAALLFGLSLGTCGAVDTRPVLGAEARAQAGLPFGEFLGDALRIGRHYLLGED